MQALQLACGVKNPLARIAMFYKKMIKVGAWFGISGNCHYICHQNNTFCSKRYINRIKTINHGIT